MTGDLVYHPRYGLGTVTGQRHRGLVLYVAFRDGYRRWVNASDVAEAPKGDLAAKTHEDGTVEIRAKTSSESKVASKEPPSLEIRESSVHSAPTTAKPATSVDFKRPAVLQRAVVSTSSASVRSPAATARTSDEQFRSRRIVEAYRLGIVPDDCVAELTEGREGEISGLLNWLRDEGEAALIVGDYGSGKSHMLQYLGVHALQAGYAVASVELDTSDTPLFKPKRLYRAVANTLRFRDPKTGVAMGFRDLVRRSLESGSLLDHRYFRHLVEGKSTEPRDEEVLWEWIEATEDIPRPIDWQDLWYGYRYNRFQYLPPIYIHSTAANIACYLLSGLGWAARNALGLKGLLLLIDEAESISMRVSPSQILAGTNMLAAMLRVSADDLRLLNDPWRHGLTFSRMSEGRLVPFLYKPECAISLAFGFTPSPIVENVDGLRRAYRVDLQRMDDMSLRAIFLRVRNHYRTAYGVSLEDGPCSRLREQLIGTATDARSFVKGSIEGLDLMRARSHAG